VAGTGVRSRVRRQRRAATPYTQVGEAATATDFSAIPLSFNMGLAFNSPNQYSITLNANYGNLAGVVNAINTQIAGQDGGAPTVQAFSGMYDGTAVLGVESTATGAGAPLPNITNESRLGWQSWFSTPGTNASHTDATITVTGPGNTTSAVTNVTSNSTTVTIGSGTITVATPASGASVTTGTADFSIAVGTGIDSLYGNVITGNHTVAVTQASAGASAAGSVAVAVPQYVLKLRG
jgi:hypothetical protein